MSKFFLRSFFCLVLLALVVSACQAAGEVPAVTVPFPTQTVTLLPSPTPEKTMNLHWSFQTNGPVWGTPALQDGIVYFGSDDGILYAVDQQGGDLKWKFASQGIIRSQPALDNGLLYFSSDDGNIYALTLADGKQAWLANIGNFTDRKQREDLGNSSAPTGYDYVQSSPVVADGTVYVGSLDGKLYALDAATGAVKWTFATQNKIRATPTVADGTVYIGSWDKILYAVDAKTGERKWASPLSGEIQSKALVADGLVYCASRKASVVALDAATGAPVWEHGYGSNMWVESSPSLSDGIIYIGSSGSKFVVGLEAKTGKPTAIYVSPDFMWSTPLIIRDTLYIGGTAYSPDKTGGLYSLKIVDGTFSSNSEDRQVFTAAETMEFSGNWNGVAGSPVAADNMIYFGALDGKLYAVNALP